MEAFDNVAQKLLLLLEKTKDSLIKDLENRFAGIREAAENLNNTLESGSNSSEFLFKDVNKGLEAGYKVIDAVFAQIGFDISHCDGLNELSSLITNTLGLLDKLKDTITPLAQAKSVEQIDFTALGEAGLGCMKDIKELIKGYQDVKTDQILSELSKAGNDCTDSFDVKDFVKKLVEHILITLLRNGQNVFSDEIRYVRMQASEIYKDISSQASGIKNRVESVIRQLEKGSADAQNAAKAFTQSLFDDSIREMEGLYSRLSAESRQTLDQIREEMEANGLDKSLYEKVADGLSKAYAILDFLGIIGEKRVEIKLPSAFLDKLDGVRSTVASSLSSTLATAVSGSTGALGNATSALEEGKGYVQKSAQEATKGMEKAAKAVGKDLKLTGELVDVSTYGITAIQQQLEFIGSNITSAGEAAQKAGTMVNKSVTDGIKALKNFSYPLTLTTFKWGRIERMFTSPVSYFKALYPIDTLEDAQQLLDKVLEIARLFNPEIPDFHSIRNLLESLLQQLTDKLMSLAGEAQSAFWKAVKPLMVTVRKVLDLLKELYQTLVSETTALLVSLKEKLMGEGSAFISEITGEVQKLYDTVNKTVQSTTVPKPIKYIGEEIVLPAILDGIDSSKAPDPEKLAQSVLSYSESELKAWANGVYANLTGFFSPKLWEKRLDTVLGQLQDTFAGDAKAVRGLLSGAMQTTLSGGWGKKMDDAFAELDITQYIDILSSALDDVSVPNPKLYYEGFRQCVANILKQAQGAAGSYSAEDVSNLAQDIATGIWNRIVDKIFTPIIRKIKARLLAMVREAVREILQRVLQLIREAQKPLESFTDQLPSLQTVREKLPTLSELGAFSQLVEEGKRGEAAQKGLTLLKDNIAVNIPVDQQWIDWIFDTANRAVVFCTSDMGYDKIWDLATGLYRNLPADLKDFVEDLLPSLPDNETIREFRDYLKTCDYKADLDNDFISVTLLQVDNKDKKEADKKADKAKEGKVNFDASALLQLCLFALDEPVKKEEDEEKEKEKDKDKKENKKAEEKPKDGDKESEEEEEETETVLYGIIILKGNVSLGFNIGKNHKMSLSVEGGTAASGDGSSKEKLQQLAQGCGLRLKKDWDLDFLFNEDALRALFRMTFERTGGEGGKPNTLEVFDTQYLALQIDNYPQQFYLGFDKTHPDLKDYGVSEENKKKTDQEESADGKKGEKDAGKEEKKKEEKKDDGPKLQVGYIGAIQDAKLILKLQEVAFVKEVLKDNIELAFSTYLWYDLQKGFDFGGDVSLHLDYDLNHKRLGPVIIDSFQLDAGVPKGESGKLALSVGTTFQVDFNGNLVIAVEDLGIGFLFNYKDKNGNYGDFDLDASLQYPTGFGITIDASVVKGGGMISINRDTGEFFGILQLDVMKKIAIGAYLLCDPGTAKGHDFNLIVLLSAEFKPGIPLGMGFSLTALGGTIGLNRQISRDSLTEGVRAGTLDQVFFVKNVEDNLAEMQTNIVHYFPAKKKQFFFGLLGQISFEPIISCSFGLLFQAPSPTEIIIVGALKADAAEGLVRINVYFAGGIRFDQGMWFDASIVDSQIVGITISGDMAFRLNWGGKKGFLISVGGFHPAYKPEESLNVGKMRRLAMKLDYSILKLSFETYLAVTSNSFQIGARFDLKVGWDSFGITGYASFDALFQFDPFLFMFSVTAGVAVKCGSWTLLSIDLSLDVQGPAPWRVAGSARFKFLLIPIEVEFSKSWGKKAPELPSKLVSVFPLLEAEWDNPNNWSAGDVLLSGQNEVALFDIEKEEGDETLVLQPDGSLSFNQAIVPFKTEESLNGKGLEKMDICNDARPEDYDCFVISSVNDESLEGGCSYTQNDFAPALYRAMGIQEKLYSPSYEKYNSGFLLDENKTRTIGKKGILERTTRHNWANGHIENGRYLVTSANNHTDRESFDRYVEALENLAETTTI